MKILALMHGHHGPHAPFCLVSVFWLVQEKRAIKEEIWSSFFFPPYLAHIFYTAVPLDISRSGRFGYLVSFI